MEILQRLFILVLKPFYCLTKDIPERAKEIVISICFSIIFVMEIFRQKDFPVFFSLNHNERCEIGCCLLFIIIIMSVKDELVVTKRCNLLAYLWIACGGIIMIISLLHPVGNGFRGLSVLMAGGFPCLYFVWNSRGDYNKLYELMAKAIVFTGGIYFVFCVMFMPFYTSYFHGNNYLGLTHNANFLGMVCTVVICAAQYLILMEAEQSKRHMLICGIAYMYLAMTGSRTSLLAAFAALAIFAVFYFKRSIQKTDNYDDRRDSRYRMAKLICLILFFITFTFIGQPIRDYCIIDYTGIPVAGEIHWNEPVASTEESSQSAVTSDFVAPVAAASAELSILDGLSTGRITIWMNYIEKWNLLGNDANKRLMIEEYGTREWAHNTFLEMAYRTGLPNGFIFFGIEILTVIYALLLMIRKKYREPYHFIAAGGSIVFFIYANLEITVFPFASPQVLLFYMAVAPLFFNNELSAREFIASRQ